MMDVYTSADAALSEYDTVYYCGDSDQGWAKKSTWINEYRSTVESADDDVDDKYWFWVDSRSKLYKSKSKDIYEMSFEDGETRWLLNSLWSPTSGRTGLTKTSSLTTKNAMAKRSTISAAAQSVTSDFFSMDLNTLPKNASSLKFSRHNAHVMSLCLTLHVNLGLQSFLKTLNSLLMDTVPTLLPNWHCHIGAELLSIEPWNTAADGKADCEDMPQKSIDIKLSDYPVSAEKGQPRPFPAFRRGWVRAKPDHGSRDWSLVGS